MAQETITRAKEQLVLDALTNALEFDVTPLQWLHAFIVDVEEYFPWNDMEDPQAAHQAYRESRRLVEKLTKIVAATEGNVHHQPSCAHMIHGYAECTCASGEFNGR